jgi:3-oxoadipate enol-lactonase
MSTAELIGPAPRIAVEHDGDGPLVILLHGIGGRRQNFTDQLPVFARDFHVAAWDARGYGDSDDYEGPLDFADFAADVVRVIDHFDFETAHLVGQSMGGRICLETYAYYPGRIATLTLAGVHASFGEFTEAKRREFVDRRRKPLVEEGKTPAEMAPALARSLVGPDVAEDVYERVVASVSALHVDSYIKTIEATTHYDRSGVLGEIAVPTLVIGGEHDSLTPPDMKRELASRIPGARLEILPDCGHMANMERPDAFNAVVLDFLRTNRDRAR